VSEPWAEAEVTINGRALTIGQVMALRVAASSFHTDMGAPDALGEDEHGRAMAAAYRARLEEVLVLLHHVSGSGERGNG
jgi:hypothetical protein